MVSHILDLSVKTPLTLHNVNNSVHYTCKLSVTRPFCHNINMTTPNYCQPTAYSHAEKPLKLRFVSSIFIQVKCVRDYHAISLILHYQVKDHDALIGLRVVLHVSTRDHNALCLVLHCNTEAIMPSVSCYIVK